MKRKYLIGAVLAAAVTAGNAFAMPEITDTADVLSARPIYQNRTSQECHMETVTNTAPQQAAERGMGGSIMGGIAGALLGAQVGGGNGKTAATAAGAIAGAIAGDRLQNNNGNVGGQPQTSQQQVCNPVSRQEVAGFEVRYAYQGREGVTVMQSAPGKTVRVGIAAY